jgi:predicted double-glycine peptidase
MIIMKKMDFPDLRQAFEYDCGAKALQAVLAYYGIDESEENIMIAAGTNQKIGTKIEGMTKVIAKYELTHDSKRMTIKDIIDYIDNDIPVLILLQAWNTEAKDYTDDYDDSHWVVAIGYSENEIYFEDPYTFTTAMLSYDELEKRWHAKEEGIIIENHGIAVYGKKPYYNSNNIVRMG